MNSQLIKLALAAILLFTVGHHAFANDPGGGTDGVGPDVTLTDNGSTVTLANGIITVVIDKNTAKLNSLKFLGTETVLSGGGNVYYSMDGTPNYRTMSGCAYTIKTNSSDMVEVAFRQTWSGQAQAFDIEAHWVLRRGDSGVYAYAMLDHPASYPNTSVGEWRMVWKLPNDLLERVYVDDLRHWQIPSSADIAAAEPTSIAEIVKLTTGVRAGYYDSKYEYAAEYENIGCWGHASNPNKIGAWIVTGNYEYFNDGPTKQDLTLSWDYNLIHFGRNHFSPGSLTYATNGVAWSKIYGPFLLYCNTNAAGGDALWADAKAQVQAEHQAWPYAWLTGNTNYPLADARGAVSGRFLVNDALKSSVSTSNAWVGLTAPGVDWQFDSDHYQYWVRAAADGSFTIANVRPGIYTLHAFTDGEMGEYALNNVVVTAGTTNELGDKTWSVPRSGNFLAWEVGVPNRSANEFRHGSSDYYEGFIWNTFAAEFPNPLEYNIGADNWSNDLNYVHCYYKVNGVREPWKWRFNFLMTSVPSSGNATLNLAFASSNGSNSQSGAPESVYVNNENSAFTSFTTPAPPAGGNALLREGVHAKYYVRQISIPVSNFHVGINTITLEMTMTSSDAAHVMYDALSLELPSKPPLPAGYDLTWTGGIASNRWDLSTTANWSDAATAQVFSDGDRVLFDDTGRNDPAIQLADVLSPGRMTVYAMKSFMFAGYGSLAGTMSLNKTGPGTLILNTTNNFSGDTTVTNGTLTVNGSLSASAVTVQNGATLSGLGSLGAGLTMQAGSVIAPGNVNSGNDVGTLTVSTLLAEAGGVTNYFDLSDDPTGLTKTNDFIQVFGDLTLSGKNTIFVHPLDGELAAGEYPLISFSGELTGGISNLVVRGVVGKPSALTNDSGTIALVVIPSRAPTNVIWQGGLAANTWDQAGTSNWVNSGAADIFTYDDHALFDDTGSISPAVNLVGAVNPSSVLVNASVNYTFAGSGSISGDGGLTKTNSGTLTLLSTNDYSGVTTVAGGTLAVSFLDNGGLPSNIGAAESDPGNLVVQSGATLRYLGATAATDHGATLLGSGVIEVSGSSANLSVNGNVEGNGALVKTGPGTLSLGGTNSYAGGTLINDGELRMGAGAASGTLGSGNVTNHGLLTFNRADETTVTSSISGDGSVMKMGGGTIILSGANTYTGGTTLSSGSLLLANHDALGTGSLTFSGSAGSSVQIGDGVTMTNAWLIPGSTTDGMMDSPSGTGIWAGPISASNGGSFRPGTSTRDGTLVITGDADIGGANFIVPYGNVIIASNGILSAGGSVCALGRSKSGQGTWFVARDNAQLTFGSGLMLGQTKLGTVYPIVCTIQDNAVLSTATASFDLHNGPSNGSTNTFLNLDGGTLLTGGLVKSQTVAGRNATIQFNGGTLKATKNNAAFLANLTGLSANVAAGGAIIDVDGFSIAISEPLAHAAELGTTPDGGLTKHGVGTLTFGIPNTYTGPTIIEQGTLALNSTVAVGSFDDSTNIFIAAGAVLDVTGRSNLTIQNHQTLSGLGSVAGGIINGSGSQLTPGEMNGGMGTLTFNSWLSLNAGSMTVMEISGSPLSNDEARVFGELTNGGTLFVTNIGTADLVVGDTFKLFDAAGYHGAFDQVKLPELTSGLAWNTNALNTAGTISVIRRSQPTFDGVEFAGNMLVISGSGGTGGGDYFVLTTTNLALPISDWTRLLTNQFDSGGQFIFTNPVMTHSPDAFFRLELP